MAELAPLHGGTDSGVEPRWDFSTNANPLGPCPSVLNAVRAADITRYPDPLYTRLRSVLASHHATTPDCIVVGAGASELILRLVRASAGPVLLLGPTFSEYARCAAVEGRRVFEARTPHAFLDLQRLHGGTGFICWPNNPTGEAWSLDFVRAAAMGGNVVIDFAYAPLASCLTAAEDAAAQTIRLYAPNKSFGLTGMRAAYAITPYPMPRLAWLAPSWVIGPDAAAFLEASVTDEALAWLEDCRPTLATWRGHLAGSLARLGLAVRESPATFLLARVGHASRVAAHVRTAGLRVRDATSFGMPEWVRIAAAPPARQAELLAALASCAALRP
jgi:histidinol-phosphate aminotransferase